MAKRRKKNPVRCSAGDQRFTVVRVDGDNGDTHAGRSFEPAMKSAGPDRGSLIDVYRTCARDAGEARLDRRGRILVRSFRYKGR